MSEWTLLIDVLNAAAGSGGVTVDAAALRLILHLLLAFLTASVLLSALLVWMIRRVTARPASRVASHEFGPSRDELRNRLAEMVRKTNDRNNYINSIFSSIEDGLLVVDSESRVVMYNHRAMALLGLGPAVFFERRDHDILATDAVSRIIETCARVARSGDLEYLTMEIQGGRLVDVSVRPIVDKYKGSAEFGSLAVVTDVTELRKLENLRRDFVANVSHEFRTPLTLISGFIELLRMHESVGAADRARAFDIMDIETERLKRLVSELLALSEIENELPRASATPFDVEPVLSEVINSLQTLADARGQRIASDILLGGVRLVGNENWFYLAVKNLVENAIKYTQDGGEISVVARTTPRAGDETNRVVEIMVRDNGIGIAPEEHERIFERFYRVEKSRGSGSGGSGLGLALVRDIAIIFGGKVEVESAPGSGATFTLRLPLAR